MWSSVGHAKEGKGDQKKEEQEKSYSNIIW